VDGTPQAFGLATGRSDYEKGLAEACARTTIDQPRKKRSPKTICQRKIGVSGRVRKSFIERGGARKRCD
jgi:hypothetical protein